MSFSPRLAALRILLLFLFIFPVAKALGNDDAQLMRKGDAAYSRRAYDSAVSYYEQAAAGKVPDATALYKLGNAHYRLHHLGEAMLSYERALVRQPGFPAAARNIRVIQQQVEPAGRKEIFLIRWWQALTAPEHSNTWAAIAILIVAVLLSLLAYNRYRRSKPEWQSPQLISIALVIAALLVIFSLAGAWRDVPKAQAVVMRQDAKFRPSSGDLKTGPLSLPEGLLIKVLNATKNEIIVALPDGQEGFVQRFDIAIVE